MTVESEVPVCNEAGDDGPAPLRLQPFRCVRCVTIVLQVESLVPGARQTGRTAPGVPGHDGGKLCC